MIIADFTVSYSVFKFYFRLFYGLFCTYYDVYWWSYRIDVSYILWVITLFWIWRTQNKLNWIEVKDILWMGQMFFVSLSEANKENCTDVTTVIHIQHFNFQLLNTTLKNVKLLKNFKIRKNCSNVFRFTRKPSSGSHSQYLAKITHLVQSGYVELKQDVCQCYGCILRPVKHV